MRIARHFPGKRPEPAAKLVRFEATDGVTLSGLLYAPPRSAPSRVVIYLHGTGGSSVFDSGRTNLLAQQFTDAGYVFFPFNNRGSHLVRRLKAGGRSHFGGSAFELIRDAVHDVDGAIREMRRRGYRDLTLVGHSTGANKIAVYQRKKPRNAARRYVLLAGGDDTGNLYDAFGPVKFKKILQQAGSLARRREGNCLAPFEVAGQMMSWRSIYDMMNPDGDYNVFPFLEVMRGVRLGRKLPFGTLKTLRKPTLMVYGDRDEYCYGDVHGCVSSMAATLAGNPNIELAIMNDADHGFSGRESELVELIVNWIERG